MDEAWKSQPDIHTTLKHHYQVNNSPDGTWVVLMGPSQAWDCMQLRLWEGTTAPGRACPIVHASFSRKFMYLVVEGAIPKYIGWWLHNISTSLGHVNHEKEIVQWMGPSLASAMLQEMCQLKYLRRNTSPPLVHSPVKYLLQLQLLRSILAATPVRYDNASTGNR